MILPDSDLATAIKNAPYDAIILPGGLQGATTLAKLESVKEILQNQEKCNRIVGAICAAPIALLSHNIAVGKELTSYPAFKEILQDTYKYSEANVVKDGNLITSRGPGTAFEFSLAIIEALCG